ncbi:ABC transporter permease [Candidatus Neomarinimicrobiota bacterium]
MKFLSLLIKTGYENIRDWKIIILTVTFAPLFVVLMYFYFEEAAGSPYRIGVVSNDINIITSRGEIFNAGDSLVSAMVAMKQEDGGELSISHVNDLDQAITNLQNRQFDLVVAIPPNFSKMIMSHMMGIREMPVALRTYGDPSNGRYIMAAVWSDMVAYEFVSALLGVENPLMIDVETISGATTPSDFALYMPGLLGLAVIMLMFTCAASLIKEKDKGTIIRLRLSNMTTSQWLAAVSVGQIVIGMAAITLTWLTGVAIGYESTGSLWLAAAVSLISCLSIIAISFIVAATLRTIFDLMTIGCFPFFILMFFSGSMFPLPQVRLFNIGAQPFHINDILPTTHSIAAFNKVLNYNAVWGDMEYEMISLILWTLVYFVFGAWLFHRRHMEVR